MFLRELDHRTNQPMLLTGALLFVTKNTIFLKKSFFSLTFDLERRLKLKVDEVGLLLRHLYAYNSVSILKPATPLRLQGRWN